MSDSPWWRRLVWLRWFRLRSIVDDEIIRAGRIEGRLDAIERKLGETLDQVGRAELRLDGAEGAIGAQGAEITKQQPLLNQAVERFDQRFDRVEARADRVETDLRAVGQESERVRDKMVPALSGRVDALLGNMMAEVDEVASLVERMLLDEPLPVMQSGQREDALEDALSEIQPLLVDEFRGGEGEIRHRLEAYLEDVRSAKAVLDLGSGRGEWLLLLRDTGIRAQGIEGDSALAHAARRRGLKIIEGDVLGQLRLQESASFGAVTAFHLFEHLDADVLGGSLAEIRRVLEPDGILLIECPDPRSLRVGGSLFWLDPTHRRPLHPETLALYLKSAGFDVLGIEGKNPFPKDQLFASDESGMPDGTSDEVSALADKVELLKTRLDDILHGSRDFVIRAKKAGEN